MAQVTIRNLDDATLAAYQRRADERGGTLQGELRAVLVSKAPQERLPPEALLAEMRRIQAMQPRPIRGCSSHIIRRARDTRDIPSSPVPR